MKTANRIFSWGLIFVFILGFAFVPRGNVQAVSTGVVISQVYGGAGCTTANCSTYKNDYVVLFNLGSSPQSINGWSVQYGSATGTSTWSGVTPLPNVSIAPGQYYLIADHLAQWSQCSSNTRYHGINRHVCDGWQGGAGEYHDSLDMLWKRLRFSGKHCRFGWLWHNSQHL